MPVTSSSLRSSVCEWVQVVLLTINLAWTTLCLGGYRAETMVITSALTGLLLAGYFLRCTFSSAMRTHPAGWLFLPFLIYAAANAAFLTPVVWLGWRDWLLWVQMIAVFWVALNGLRSARVWRALAAMVAIIGVAAVALACYQRFVKSDWLITGLAFVNGERVTIAVDEIQK